MLVNKKQRSHESAAKDIPVSMRKRGPRRQALRQTGKEDKQGFARMEGANPEVQRRSEVEGSG